MRKNLLLTLVISFLFISAKAQENENSFPTFQKVVEKFFRSYSVDVLTENQHIKFEKRPLGWFVGVNDYALDGKEIKNELFWDSQTLRYRIIDFAKLDNRNENEYQIQNYLHIWDKDYYSICPFYGYSDWDFDVIENYKNTENLSDTVLYALGRAYSSYASNLLNNNSGMASNKRAFELKSAPNAMSEEQLKEYRFFRHKAIEKFELLDKRNPDFQTIVGPIAVKKANEHMTAYLDLLQYQNISEATKELKPNLYPSFYIALAKNYLTTCKPNAILVTNGDNDTYPLIYVQAQMNYRPDVRVVNLSLLQTTDYINSQTIDFLNAKALPISFSKEQLEKLKGNIVVVEKADNGFYDLKSVLDLAKNEDNKLTFNSIEYFSTNTKQLKIINGKDSMKWESPTNYYLLNELIFMDILSNNQWKRPIYFAITVPENSFWGLKNYLKLQGLAYEVGSSLSENEEELGQIETTIMNNNLLKNFDWNGLENMTRNEELICTSYLSNFHRLAKAYLDTNQKKKAKKVLAHYYKLFENINFEQEEYKLMLIEDFYRIKDFKTGNEIAKTILNSLKTNNPNNNEEVSYKNIVIEEEIKNLLDQYNQPALFE